MTEVREGVLRVGNVPPPGKGRVTLTIEGRDLDTIGPSTSKPEEHNYWGMKAK